MMDQPMTDTLQTFLPYAHENETSWKGLLSKVRSLPALMVCNDAVSIDIQYLPIYLETTSIPFLSSCPLSITILRCYAFNNSTKLFVGNTSRVFENSLQRYMSVLS